MLWVTDMNFDAAWAGGQTNTALYKPKRDYADYVAQVGAKRLGLEIYFDGEESAEHLSTRVDGILSQFNIGDTLIIQLPTYSAAGKLIKVLVDKIHNVFHGKAIAMWHDYDPLMLGFEENQRQYGNMNALDIMFNNNTFNTLAPLFDAMIVHSEKMKNTLKDWLNYEKPIITQGPFGYEIAEDIVIPNHEFSRKIVYAGSMSKAHYLENIPAGWDVEAIGAVPTPEILNNPHVNYLGETVPSELPAKLPDGFALVWSSDSFDKVDGLGGTYSQYNYPHKLSAYLVAKLPIIIWKGAAPANWVVENGLGFAVDKLSDIKPRLDKIDEEQYLEYQQNLTTMSELIREGFYTKKAALTAYKAANQVNYKTGF